MAFAWTPDLVERVRDYPHYLGHMVGKTKLTPLHSDWCKMVWDSPGGRHFSLMAHRGAYKTTAITEVGIVYYLLFHPSERIALVRETWTEAASTLETIKAYMRNPAIQSLFAYLHGKAPSEVRAPFGSVTYDFKRTITKEGSIDAYGINQVPTGRHYDRILCDDIITIKDRLSRAHREMVKQGVLEIMTNIVDPGKNCLFVGTPWHYDDAWAMKNDAGKLIIPQAVKYRPQDTKILSDEELAEKRATTTASLFAINYMLDTSVKDEGQIFDEPIYGEWDWTIRPTRIHGHMDAAWDGTCTNALTIMAERPDGKIQAYGKVYPGTFDSCKMDFARECRSRNVRNFHIEKNPDKGMAAGDLKKIPGFPTVHAYSESMNKDIKIVSFLKKYWQRIVWDPNTDPNYLNQINDFRPGQDPRDAPDSASSLLRQAFYKGGGPGALYT